MKSVYVVLVKWFAPQNGVMASISPDSGDLKVFSSKSRALRYLDNVCEFNQKQGHKVERFNNHEFKVTFIESGIFYRKEYVLMKQFVNLYDYE